MKELFCKATKCQWNAWNEEKKKHACIKEIVHLDAHGRCQLSEFARPIASQQGQSSGRDDTKLQCVCYGTGGYYHHGKCPKVNNSRR